MSGKCLCIAEVVLVQGQLCVSGACSGAGLGAACCLFVQPCLVQSVAQLSFPSLGAPVPVSPLRGVTLSPLFTSFSLSLPSSLLITVPVLLPSPPFFRPFTPCALHEESQLALTLPAEASLWLGLRTYDPALPTTHPHALLLGHSTV